MGNRYGRLNNDSPLQGPSSVRAQANALFRKNLTFQRRNKKQNCGLFSLPILLFVILVFTHSVQLYMFKKEKPPQECHCTCVDTDRDGSCEPVCKVPSTNDPSPCSLPSPPKFPPVLQVPKPEYRAVRTDYMAFPGLPSDSCRSTNSCSVTVLVTGGNQSLGESLAGNFFSSDHFNSTENLEDLPNGVVGSSSAPQLFRIDGSPMFTFTAQVEDLKPLYVIQSQCPLDPTSSTTSIDMGFAGQPEATCLEGIFIWRKSSSAVNDELFNGYFAGNPDKKTNEIFAAYDFLNSDENNFNVSIWYNASYRSMQGTEQAQLRVPGLVNVVSNAYLKFLGGDGISAQFDFLQEMPQIVVKPELQLYQPGALFLVWVILQLFPADAPTMFIREIMGHRRKRLPSIHTRCIDLHVDDPVMCQQFFRFEDPRNLEFSDTLLDHHQTSLRTHEVYVVVILWFNQVVLTSLVYEKEQKLRIMMKMHGLGDVSYWLISYAYFFILSSTYILCIMVFGTFTGMTMFTLNDHSIQFLFYFIYINLQIVMAFLSATVFSSVKTAAVIGYIYVIGTGLLGTYLFEPFIKEESFPRSWLVAMEIFPSFSLFRGMFEFCDYVKGAGMRWKDMHDEFNGMKEVLIIMSVEWCIFLLVAYHLDQVLSVGSGVMKHPLFFLQNFQKKRSIYLGGEDSKDDAQMNKPDILQERKKVDQLLVEPSTNYAVVCDKLEKIYPGMDGNPDKYAVRGFSLALPQGECFGMLGPNGAGKTSSISMMIGLIAPSSGTAFVQGLDIRNDMNRIYTCMGVCPQHDLLWETLTGREHLLFYGRLKNLRGAALTEAVEESLKSFNLFYGGVADKQAKQYSGGMKRRLSVAISLIGDPRVVYLDEPSTGLDPASRNLLWNVVKRAKKNRAIILTTHSMEEAEYLCDRLGIFVDGRFTCIGNAKELKARYGGEYVFTMTTSSSNEKDVEKLVRRFSPGAKKTYHLSGTQKYELPKNEVRIADVFQAVEDAKRKFEIQAWGISDTTLEDVFIKVARSA